MPAKANLEAKLSLDHAGFTAGLRQAQANSERFKGGITSNFAAMSKGMSAIPAGLKSQIAGSLGGLLAAGTFAEGIKGAIGLGAGMRNLSKSTGVAVGELYALRGAFEDEGKDADSIASAMAKMQKHIAKGGDEFGKLGLSIDHLNTLRPAQQFQEIARGINGIENPTQKAAAAMSIFGKSGASLIPVFQNVANLDLSKMSAAGSILDRNAEAMHKLSASAKLAHRNIQGLWIGMAAGAGKGMQEGLDNMKGSGNQFAEVGEQLGKILGTGLSKGAKMFAQDLKDMSAIGKMLGLNIKDDGPIAQAQKSMVSKGAGLPPSARETFRSTFKGFDNASRLSGLDFFDQNPRSKPNFRAAVAAAGMAHDSLLTAHRMADSGDAPGPAGLAGWNMVDMIIDGQRGMRPNLAAGHLSPLSTFGHLGSLTSGGIMSKAHPTGVFAGATARSEGAMTNEAMLGHLKELTSELKKLNGTTERAWN